MKKLFVVVLAFMLCSVALAEGLDWTSMTDDELHSIIDHARNELTKRELVAGEKTVLVDQDGIQFYLTGEYEFADRDVDRKMVELQTVLINDSSNNVGITIDSLYVNGWNIFALCGAQAAAGKRDKSTIDMNVFDAEVTAFEDIKEMEFTIKVYDLDTYNDIAIIDSVVVHYN